MKVSTKLEALAVSIVGAAVLFASISGSAEADPVASADFESGDFSGWNIGTQTGSLTGGVITQNGTGATVVSGEQTFSAGSHQAVGSPTYNDQPNPYYAPAVSPATWSFSPFGTYAAALQPGNSSPVFDVAINEIGLSSTHSASIKSLLVDQRTAACATGVCGNADPTNAAWMVKQVTLQAGTIYTMSWNYIGTDYVPFNDGSITSLVPIDSTSSATISVNNQVGNYALLGFTNPGTGDYSTGSFGSTGWQISTYEVSETGEYLLGFAVFNLGDTGLSPVLLVDSEPGQTLKNGETFGAVVPNNPSAPTVAPTTTPETSVPTTTSEAPTTTETPSTTEAPTTTQAPTTTEVIQVPIYNPPTTTSVVVPESTTTTGAPTESMAPESAPTTSPIMTLPVTGSETDLTGILAFSFLMAGYGIYRIGKRKK